MTGWTRVVLALAVFTVSTAFFALLHVIARRTGLVPLATAPRHWHRLILRLLAMKVHVTGTPATDRPLMIVSNHVSWSDIMVIGSVADVHFIARGDMANWPVMGVLCRLRETVFVDRKSRRRAAEQAAEIAAFLEAGKVLVLFAEGTTGDGNAVLPFKSTLFASLYSDSRDGREERPFASVQPVSVAYVRSYGVPLDCRERTRYAWIGDQSLWPHLSMLLKGGAVDVELRFGEPIRPDQAGTRKALSARAEAEVRALTVSSQRPSAPRHP